MKSHRPTIILVLTLLVLSLVFLSSGTVRAASIVRSDTWIGRLPEAKGLNAGVVKIKRAAVNHWVRFETPAVSRRGTLTLSSGTLQFIKGKGSALPELRAAKFVAQPLTLAVGESAESPMINIEVASVENENSGTFTLANASELLQAAAEFHQLPFDESIAADFAISDNLGSAVAANSISTVASGEAQTPISGQGPVPVPEPSVAALSALAVVGLLARRRSR